MHRFLLAAKHGHSRPIALTNRLHPSSSVRSSIGLQHPLSPPTAFRLYSTAANCRLHSSHCRRCTLSTTQPLLHTVPIRSFTSRPLLSTSSTKDDSNNNNSNKKTNEPIDHKDVTNEKEPSSSDPPTDTNWHEADEINPSSSEIIVNDQGEMILDEADYELDEENEDDGLEEDEEDALDQEDEDELDSSELDALESPYDTNHVHSLVQSAAEQQQWESMFKRELARLDPLITDQDPNNPINAPILASGDSNNVNDFPHSNNNNPTNSNSSSAPPSSSSPPQFSETDLHDWGVDEFRPYIIYPHGSRNADPFATEKTNASSAAIPRPKDVLFVGFNSRMVLLPGQPFSIALPRNILTTLRVQFTASELAVTRRNSPPKRMFIGLFFQKEKITTPVPYPTINPIDSTQTESNPISSPTATPPAVEKDVKSSTTAAPSAASSTSSSKPSGTGVHQPDRELLDCDSYTVVDDYTALLKQTMDNSDGRKPDKFYIIQLLRDHAGRYHCWTRWGHVGESYGCILEPCGDLASGIKAFESKFKDATKNNWNKRANFVKHPDKYELVEIDENGDEKTTPADASSHALVSTPPPPATVPIVDLTAFEPVGLLAEVVQMESSSSYVLVLCHRRITLDGTKGSPISALQPNMKVHITHHEDATWQQLKPATLRYNQELILLKNQCLRILRTIRQLEGAKKFEQRQKAFFTFNNASPGSIIDYWSTLSSNSHFASSNSQMSPSEFQLLNWTRGTLTSIPLITRLKCVLELLTHELKLVNKQKHIETMTKEHLANEQLELLNAQRKQIDEKIQQANAAAAAAANPSTSSTTSGPGTIPGGPPPDLRSEKDKLFEKWHQRLQGKSVPPDVLAVIDEEQEKFRGMDSENSFEYSNVRNYLDWLTCLPWNHYTPESYDIRRAERVLNEDHFGMEDVKDRILEFIATSKLVGTMPRGKIICLVGPPGVGKTSIGKSIARALDRQFYRFSVGGMDDVSEIKGHRRTYVGSMPGKLVQSLKRVECSNPVILIDEIDKLSRGGHRGDPASALLEVLDPEQNKEFMDHYLDVPVDLSKVLFICTANDRDTIPGPLADRMDFIELSGYLAKEKVSIASKYLEPVIRARTGVSTDQLKIEESALFHLIRWYCREAGVRSLQKYLEQIYRKVALNITRQTKKLEKEAAKASTTNEINTTTTTPTATPSSESTNFPQVVITTSNLAEYAGPPNYISDKLYETNPIGVSTGLAYSSNGGAVLFIESVAADVTHAPEIPRATALDDESINQPMRPHRRPVVDDEDIWDEDDEDQDSNEDESDNNPTKSRYHGRGELFCTGQLGNVMKESSSIAYTVAKRILVQRTSPNSIYRSFFDDHRVHLHLPGGAIPKDGPSAGIAMVTSLLSLALQTPPIHSHAMTGELTLTGKVLPIGGVKEKLMSAKHAGISLIVLPVENRRDVDELKPYVIEGMTIHYAKTYDDVFKIIFPHFVDKLTPAASINTHPPILTPTANRRKPSASL